ncbi:phage tail protein [Weissella oryzae SG25]|uniref:Phage tail protein n=1 Tax=Weissella oryzae (strain DSM 25784 / JCM 18191 / LMG 30913 / SG25) TaxID=1329250 RepID=A0A069CW17_WEIOS|nr:phage tail domain-containing protein [Weissella oryzae]GAK31995.1 phage tail protein [Weissella oryzae SG25]
MDLLVETNNQTYVLSNTGVFVKDVKIGAPSIDISSNTINFKNGKLFSGATYSEKKITVSGSYYAENERMDQEMQDKLNFLFARTEPFYISQMFRSGGQYEYERPGQNTGSTLNNQDDPMPYHYRFKVLLSDNIDYDFQGKTGAGLLTNVSFEFKTVDIPFGMGQIENEILTDEGSIPYNGTADVSQLEWPFYFVLTSKQAQGKAFDFTVGTETFTYDGDVSIKAGDIFELRGTSFLLNGLNINDHTNIQYFMFKAQQENIIETNFIGDIELKNKIAFYV